MQPSRIDERKIDESEIDKRKKKAREHFKAIRSAIPADERARRDAAIQRRVCALPEFGRAEVVFSYLSFGAEVQTRDLIRAAWAADKIVALPWCVPHTREMRWFRITSFDDLVRSSFGVDEPRPDPAHEQWPSASVPSLAVVPGLTFDASGYRLGYGGGFYDESLATFSGASVGLCREAQFSNDLVEQGIIDAHDLPVSIVVTEKRTIRSTGNRGCA